MGKSIIHSRAEIEEDDIVIIFMSRDNMTAIKVTRGEEFHNKFGRYKHDDMIGKKFGTKMHSPPPQSGYIHLLRPTPELWTLSLPHRTQILYMPDIAYITMRLGVRPGSKVLEAGTGSGSMTHSLSRTVGERGTVYSFEYHKARFEKAGEEFEDHGLSNVVLRHRNVCKDGFADVADADAIFLDLPAPWEAIPFAVKALNPEIMTRICCFSPCIEQVTKTAAALRAEGFNDVSTQEVLVRTYDLAMPPTAGSHHLEDVSEIAARLREHEKRKEARRVMQMRNARERSRLAKEAEAKANEEEAENVKAEESGNADDEGSAGDKRKLEHGSAPAKRPRPDARTGDGSDSESESVAQQYAARYNEPKVAWSSMALTKPSPEMRGHTSYLTFATFYPASIRAKLAEQQAHPSEPVTRLGTPAGGAAETAELAASAVEST